MWLSEVKKDTCISKWFIVTAVFICLHLKLTFAIPGNDRDFMYPDQIAAPECKTRESIMYCTEVENYPAAEIDRLVRANLDKYSLLFGEDRLVEPNIGTRFDVPGEDSLCTSTERVIFPKLLKSQDKNQYLIVNTERYKQGIRIEECLSKSVNKNCHLINDTLPNHYESVCRQEYSYRPLLAVQRGAIRNNTPETAQFMFPLSCKCKIRKI